MFSDRSRRRAAFYIYKCVIRGTGKRTTAQQRRHAGLRAGIHVGGAGEDGRDVACSVSDSDGTTAQQCRHPVLRHGALGGAGEDGQQRGGSAIPRIRPPKIPGQARNDRRGRPDSWCKVSAIVLARITEPPPNWHASE